MRMYAGLDTLDFDRVKIHVWLRRGRNANLGGTELGDASTAILTELLKHLIEINVITPQATGGNLFEKATGALESLGNRTGVLGAIKVIADVGSDLGKQRIA